MRGVGTSFFLSLMKSHIFTHLGVAKLLFALGVGWGDGGKSPKWRHHLEELLKTLADIHVWRTQVGWVFFFGTSSCMSKLSTLARLKIELLLLLFLLFPSSSWRLAHTHRKAVGLLPPPPPTHPPTHSCFPTSEGEISNLSPLPSPTCHNSCITMTRKKNCSSAYFLFLLVKDAGWWMFFNLLALLVSVSLIFWEVQKLVKKKKLARLLGT